MPDTYATIDQADEAVQRRLADVLELRAADPQQQAMLADYLRDLVLPSGARVVEIGCGTGAVCRAVALRPEVREVVGVDPSPVFIERARELAGAADRLTFVVGDGRALALDDASFDAVICHTTLCHIPAPEKVLAEARRVTAGGGWLALFDGDYVTTTVATSPTDPLQSCIDAAVETLVHDPLLVRRLPALVSGAGWKLVQVRSHGYVETKEPQYMLTLVDRGADALVSLGRLGEPAAQALKDEARRRVESDEFYGHIAYASLLARKPG